MWIHPNSDDTYQHCERSPETQNHKYIECESVREVRGWVRFRLNLKNSSHITLDDADFLYLRFSGGLKVEDILWLLGVYLEYIEDKVVLRGGVASVDDFIGYVKYMRVVANFQAMPSLGLIPGMNSTNLNAMELPRRVSLASDT